MSFLYPAFLLGALAVAHSHRAAPAASRRCARSAVYGRAAAAQIAGRARANAGGCGICFCWRRASRRCCCSPRRLLVPTAGAAPAAGARRGRSTGRTAWARRASSPRRCDRAREADRGDAARGASRGHRLRRSRRRSRARRAGQPMLARRSMVLLRASARRATNRCFSRRPNSQVVAPGRLVHRHRSSACRLGRGVRVAAPGGLDARDRRRVCAERASRRAESRGDRRAVSKRVASWPRSGMAGRSPRSGSVRVVARRAGSGRGQINVACRRRRRGADRVACPDVGSASASRSTIRSGPAGGQRPIRRRWAGRRSPTALIVTVGGLRMAQRGMSRWRKPPALYLSRALGASSGGDVDVVSASRLASMSPEALATRPRGGAPLDARAGACRARAAHGTTCAPAADSSLRRRPISSVPMLAEMTGWQPPTGGASSKPVR